ncbi:glycosyltransferase family 4 protein [Paraconexibacter algicola]|uniref:glycosyltransferase family 4 protein n=1 Tax=Paraconexibacter algicola TaxID=2133960 RepID=UPI001304E667|nr:glycosyltransferase family 4 protein [Paraconexibacter algicola]
MSASLRVLAVQEAYPPVVGGLERHTRTVSHELATRGHAVTVAVTHHDGLAASDGPVRLERLEMLAARLPSDLSRDHMPFVQHPPLPDPLTVRSLRRLIARDRPDVVHARSWMVHSLLAAVRGLAHPPKVVVSVHDYFPVCANRSLMRDGAPCGGPRLAACVTCSARVSSAPVGVAKALGVHGGRRRLAGIDRWLAVSETVRQAIAPVVPGGLRAIEVVGSTVPDAVFDPLDPTVAPPLDGPYVLFVGSVLPFKGVDVLLDAHARLGAAAPPLVLLGSGRPDRLGPRVHAVGPRPHPEVMAAWRHAQVGVIPSRWPEPFGQVAVEAMASGVPLVASDTGGLRDIVVDEHTGLLVPPGDPVELAAALARLLADDALRARLAAAGPVRARRYHVARFVDRLEEIYADAVAAPAAGNSRPVALAR